MWKIGWIIPAFWTLLAYFVLVVICLLWAPARNPTRYVVLIPNMSGLVCMNAEMPEP
ncbi:hypothetical protein LINGRAHAP2_LOCUS4696 [Linum grandiflorum]